jgi:hypothetical protein
MNLHRFFPPLLVEIISGVVMVVVWIVETERPSLIWLSAGILIRFIFQIIIWKQGKAKGQLKYNTVELIYILIIALPFRDLAPDMLLGIAAGLHIPDIVKIIFYHIKHRRLLSMQDIFDLDGLRD